MSRNMLISYLRMLLQNILDILIIYMKFGAITLILYFVAEWYILRYDNSSSNNSNSILSNIYAHVSNMGSYLTNGKHNGDNDNINQNNHGDDLIMNIQRATTYSKYINNQTDAILNIVNKLYKFIVDILIT